MGDGIWKFESHKDLKNSFSFNSEKPSKERKWRLRWVNFTEHHFWEWKQFGFFFKKYSVIFLKIFSRGMSYLNIAIVFGHFWHNGKNPNIYTFILEIIQRIYYILWQWLFYWLTNIQLVNCCLYIIVISAFYILINYLFYGVLGNVCFIFFIENTYCTCLWKIIN